MLDGGRRQRRVNAKSTRLSVKEDDTWKCEAKSEWRKVAKLHNRQQKSCNHVRKIQHAFVSTDVDGCATDLALNNGVNRLRRVKEDRKKRQSRQVWVRKVYSLKDNFETQTNSSSGWWKRKSVDKFRVGACIRMESQKKTKKTRVGLDGRKLPMTTRVKQAKGIAPSSSLPPDAPPLALTRWKTEGSSNNDGRKWGRRNEGKKNGGGNSEQKEMKVRAKKERERQTETDTDEQECEWTRWNDVIRR